MSEPPRFSLVVEDTTKTEDRGAEPKTEVPEVVVSTPTAGPPILVVQPASDDLVRPDPPRLDKGKRVMSMPPGGIDRMLAYPDMRETQPLVRGGRVLKTPAKLGGERGRGRWSDVPAYWKQGSIDPLRCHSVDQLPRPSWQSG